MIDITISSLRRADAHLATGKFDALLSISGPDKDKHCTRRTGNDLLLKLWDTTPVVKSRRPLPTAGDVVKIIRWAQALPEDARVLVHCAAGRSRSTAAAAIVLASGNSEGENWAWWYSESVMEAVYEAAPKATPNWYLLAMADELLGTNMLGYCRHNERPLKKTKRDVRL